MFLELFSYSLIYFLSQQKFPTAFNSIVFIFDVNRRVQILSLRLLCSLRTTANNYQGLEMILSRRHVSSSSLFPILFNLSNECLLLLHNPAEYCNSFSSWADHKEIRKTKCIRYSTEQCCLWHV